jgi:hypothetical protein
MSTFEFPASASIAAYGFREPGREGADLRFRGRKESQGGESIRPSNTGSEVQHVQQAGGEPKMSWPPKSQTMAERMHRVLGTDFGLGEAERSKYTYDEEELIDEAQTEQERRYFAGDYTEDQAPRLFGGLTREVRRA